MFSWTFMTPPPDKDEAFALAMLASQWTSDQKEVFAAVVAVAFNLLPCWRPETRALAYAALSLSAPDIGVLLLADDPRDGFGLTERGLRLVAAQSIPAILRRTSRHY